MNIFQLFKITFFVKCEISRYYSSLVNILWNSNQYFKQLQADAAELAKEALECEIKEEKLVTDAVKHLNDANLQINSLSKRIIGKADESQKQKEKIAVLLSQVIFMIWGASM